jgi:succinate dehydrogenase / fumarate reductase cytochrome b subunit
MESSSSTERQKPLSPNIQLYRPQLTSVLSILNRLTGVLLSVAAIALVIWLLAAATGPEAYSGVRTALASWVGQVFLFGCTFAFFLHFFGGIRHLLWDTVHGFELWEIYMSGWTVVAASIVMTITTWVTSFYIGG